MKAKTDIRQYFTEEGAFKDSIMEAMSDVRERRHHRGVQTRAKQVLKDAVNQARQKTQLAVKLQAKPRKLPEPPSNQEEIEDHRLLSCHMCFQDRREDQIGIACNSCGYWFHYKCVNFTPETAELRKRPYCSGTVIRSERLEYEELYVGVRPVRKQTEHVKFCGRCGQDNTHDSFLIACDRCQNWFHGKCVQITPAKADHINIPNLHHVGAKGHVSE